jgi:thymidylate synthase ThyX
MLNYDLEAYLNEIGVISNEGLSTLEEILDPRYATLAKGYFNDPRDENERYSDNIDFTDREFRRQDETNRQNSIDDLGKAAHRRAADLMALVQTISSSGYRELRELNVAKECVRVLLPEGLTMSRLYVNGTLRSWLHYLDVRDDIGVTQLEHVQLAREIKKALKVAFPVVFNLKSKEDG